MLRNPVGLCVLVAMLCGTAWGATKLPVPDASEQKPAMASVKEVFKSELAAAKHSEQMADVAERMLANLQGETSSAVSDYVLLTQAHGLAVKGLRPTLSLRIVQMISDRYDVDPHALTVQTLKDLAKTPTDQEYHQALAAKALSVASEQIAAERFDTAKDCYEVVSSIGLKLKSADLGKKAIAGRTDLTELKKLADKLPMARSALENKADDAPANSSTAENTKCRNMTKPCAPQAGSPATSPGIPTRTESLAAY